MPEQHLYEYAVIRVVPRVAREEFINAGVVLYCSRKKFLQALYVTDEARLSALCPSLDIAETTAYLDAFARICVGGKAAGTIGALGPAERFRWLTATRSTIVQCSKVHPGFCGADPAATLDRLFQQLVL